MAGVRSKVRQYASCCLIDVDDTLPSIFSSSTAAGYATGSRYGIGLNMGRIRPLNSPIRNGEVVHTAELIALEDIESKGFFGRLWSRFILWLMSLFGIS